MSDQKGSPSRRRDDEIFRLKAELEQVQTALESAQEEVSALAAERGQLLRECQRHVENLRLVQERHDRLLAAEEPPLDILTEQEKRRHTEEELRVAFEELQVLTGELEEANVALRRANQELDDRVMERTRELVAANAALDESRKRLSMAMRHAGAGAWDLDITADRVVWSPEYLALTGLSPEPTRRGWLSTIQLQDRARVAETLDTGLAHGWPDISLEYRVRHPLRGTRWMSLRAHLLKDRQGKPIRLIGLVVDMTDRKLVEVTLERTNADLSRRVAEEVAAREEMQGRLFQQQKLDAMGHLTGGIAHDFNNLLMVVRSGLHLLSGLEDAARREYLIGRMEEATARGADLTRRLLAFGRRETLRPEFVDLRSHLDGLRDLLVHSLREDIALEIDLPEELWPVEVDLGALELALLNLTVNARDAMPSGGKVALRGRNHALDAEEAAGLGLKCGNFVEICVADEGMGMSRELRERVFEPFFTTKEAGHGTGLGLSQVYGFAQQSGGTVRLESEEGRGTAVTLILPRAGRRTRRTGMAAHSEAPEAAGPGTILVVEDDEEVAVLVGDLLKRLGHSPVHAATAEAATERLAEGGIDLLFTDILLGNGPSGLDLAREVAERWPDMPVVLTTGYGGEMAHDVAKVDYPLLRKPYALEDLRRTLAASLPAKVAG